MNISLKSDVIDSMLALSFNVAQSRIASGHAWLIVLQGREHGKGNLAGLLARQVAGGSG